MRQSQACSAPQETWDATSRLGDPAGSGVRSSWRFGLVAHGGKFPLKGTVDSRPSRPYLHAPQHFVVVLGAPVRVPRFAAIVCAAAAVVVSSALPASANVAYPSSCPAQSTGDWIPNCYLGTDGSRYYNSANLVTGVQWIMHYRGGYYTGAIDGSYGTGTAAGVKKLQTDLHVTSDGVLGSNTWQGARACTIVSTRQDANYYYYKPTKANDCFTVTGIEIFAEQKYVTDKMYNLNKAGNAFVDFSVLAPQ